MRAGLPFLILALAVSLMLLVWHFHSTSNSRPASGPASSYQFSNAVSATNPAHAPSGTTMLKAHNLRLRKGPNFRVYVRWLHGKMIPTHNRIDPSFDDPESFFLDIESGVIRANIGDISNFLNVSGSGSSPLKKITLSGDGNQVKINGTLHKIFPLPIELIATIAPAADNQIQMHVEKLSILKVPLIGLLSRIHITISDLIHPGGVPGIKVSGDDIFFDTQKLLPPPHLWGQLTSVHIVNPDLEVIYGNAQNAATQVEQWRNFLQLRGGNIEFGKLTMHDVDLVMIDISNDAWFDLDLAHYQQQLVNGYTRMTPQAGLQIFMPDLDELPPSKANLDVTMEWLKNRNLPPPADLSAR